MAGASDFPAAGKADMDTYSPRDVDVNPGKGVGLHLVGDEYFRHAFQMDQGSDAFMLFRSSWLCLARAILIIRTHTWFG